MNTATTSPRVIVYAPGSLLAYCNQMEKLNKYLNETVVQPMQRAQVYLTEQYMKSPLGKKRTAKINLTAACNRAITKMRRTYRTYHELVATLFAYTDTKLFRLPHELFIELQHANAPNMFASQNNLDLRQQSITAKVDNTT